MRYIVTGGSGVHDAKLKLCTICGNNAALWADRFGMGVSDLRQPGQLWKLGDAAARYPAATPVEDILELGKGRPSAIDRVKTRW